MDFHDLGPFQSLASPAHDSWAKRQYEAASEPHPLTPEQSPESARLYHAHGAITHQACAGNSSFNTSVSDFDLNPSTKPSNEHRMTTYEPRIPMIVPAFSPENLLMPFSTPVNREDIDLHSRTPPIEFSEIRMNCRYVGPPSMCDLEY